MEAFITQCTGLDPNTLMAALFITYIAATVQATIGFGFSLICIPVLSLINPSLTPVPQLFALAPLTIGMAWRERHQVDLKGVSWVIMGRLVGAALGVACLELATPSAISVLIGSIVLLAVVLILKKPELKRRPLTEFSAGTVSGLSALVSSIGGPMLALLYRNETGGALRASLASVFVIGLAFSFGGRLLSGHITAQDAWIGMCLIPAVILGLKSSSRFLKYIEGSILRWGIILIAGGSSLAMIVRGLLA